MGETQRVHSQVGREGDRADVLMVIGVNETMGVVKGCLELRILQLSASLWDLGLEAEELLSWHLGKTVSSWKPGTGSFVPRASLAWCLPRGGGGVNIC